MDTQNFIQSNLLKRTILSYLLYPLSCVYSLLQIIHRFYYRIFPKSIYHSPIPVISIGNIVSGGSGKTPFTVFLVKYLTNAGKRVAVSHRDYKGNYENDNEFLSNREGLLPQVMEAGDEAALLAEKLLGIPVIAGKSRKRSLILLAETYPDLDYIILDDSFQHLKVHHDYDFILFKARAGIGNGFVLPAGILREPLSALKDADFIVWNGTQPIVNQLLTYPLPILKGSTESREIKDIHQNIIPLEKLKDKKLALLSGIGYPQGFEDTVHKMGLSFLHHYRVPDHYDYTSKLFRRHLKRGFQIQKYDYLITTEKDFIKLRQIHLRLPILIVEIEFIPEAESLPLISFLTS